ncbi:hypothetical protein LCGC14_1472320 [marine sediment metagenome]|uniref:Uncharacterized protein n=1 Tax=marine sediment metagenome TaxID=412755 RepID=A0A0F9JXZ2_9ZZZZ
MLSWRDGVMHHLRAMFWENFYWIPIHECTCGVQYFPVIPRQTRCERCGEPA